LPSLVFIAASESGYANLVRLVSRAYLSTGEGEPVHVTPAWIGELAEGVICLTGGPDGPIGRELKAGHRTLAEQRLAALHRWFGDRLYVELQRCGNWDRALEAETVRLAYDHRLPLVATNEAFFPARGDYDAHDALIAIAEGTVIAVDERRKLTPDNHLRSQDDATLAKLVTPFLAERGVEVAADDARLVNAIAPVKLRATTLIDLAEGLDYLFRPDAEIAPENDKAAKHLKPATAPYLEKVLEVVRATEPFTAEALAGPIESWVEAEELKMGKVAQPVRVAITGRTRSPGLFETLELVGKEASIARLEQALERARAAE